MKKIFRNIKKKLLMYLPDKLYLQLMFYKDMGKKLNLKNPQTFSEKLQWLKLYDRKAIYTQLVDKYAVRDFIKNKIGEQYLIPLIGVWNEVDEIDFETLPNQFVLKCTHDSGGVIVCHDKSKLDIKDMKEKLKKNLSKNYYYEWREWPYKNIKPRIICEQLMIDQDKRELKDYKFMCFNGIVRCILVCSDRTSGDGLKLDFYDPSWNKLPFRRPKYENSINDVPKPNNLEKMIQLAGILSEDMSFIRVDFYEINNEIYFGELTFYPSAGLQGFYPNSYDEVIGSWLTLPEKNS